MATDFIDDDLLQEVAPQKPTTSPKGAKRLTDERERTVERSANASEELERLRMRQEELEQERTQLQEQARKQELYARGKRDLSEGLNSSIVWMEKQHIQASRLAELLAATRSQCKAMLDELHGLHEESWDRDSFSEELSRSLALIETIRLGYNKAIAKVEAEGVARDGSSASSISVTGGAGAASHGFFFWLKAGLAFSLPLIIVILGLFLGYMFSTGSFKF